MSSRWWFGSPESYVPWSRFPRRYFHYGVSAFRRTVLRRQRPMWRNIGNYFGRDVLETPFSASGIGRTERMSRRKCRLNDLVKDAANRTGRLKTRFQTRTEALWKAHFFSAKLLNRLSPLAMLRRQNLTISRTYDLSPRNSVTSFTWR